MQRFRDRTEAGRQIAQKLGHLRGADDLIILGLPRGGVPVAYEVARALNAPLDVFIVRKLGVPGHEELAMGAVASGGVMVLNHKIIDTLGLPQSIVDAVGEHEGANIEQRELTYRRHRPAYTIEGHHAILVDDGLATGASMLAAVRALRRLEPTSVTVAVPVGYGEACWAIEREADELLCLERPAPFGSVGAWYEDFGPISDAEVCELLQGLAMELRLGAELNYPTSSRGTDRDQSGIGSTYNGPG